VLLTVRQPKHSTTQKDRDHSSPITSQFNFINSSNYPKQPLRAVAICKRTNLVEVVHLETRNAVG
jgi:hypothetical protein